MSLNPVEVRERRFRVVFRGYAVEEVDSFLDEVEEALASADVAVPGPAPRPDTEPPVTAVPRPRRASDADESAPQAAPAQGLRLLTLAEQTADALVAQARTEADELRQAAARDAEQVRVLALRETERLRAEAAADAAATVGQARQEADALLGQVQAEADRCTTELADRRTRELGELQLQAVSLRREVERLREAEEEHRTRMQALLQDQLRLVEQGRAA